MWGAVDYKEKRYCEFWQMKCTVDFLLDFIFFFYVKRNYLKEV